MKEIESLKSRIKVLIDTVALIADDPTPAEKDALVETVVDVLVDVVRAARAVWESR